MNELKKLLKPMLYFPKAKIDKTTRRRLIDSFFGIPIGDDFIRGDLGIIFAPIRHNWLYGISGDYDLEGQMTKLAERNGTTVDHEIQHVFSEFEPLLKAEFEEAGLSEQFEVFKMAMIVKPKQTAVALRPMQDILYKKLSFNGLLMFPPFLALIVWLYGANWKFLYYVLFSIGFTEVFSYISETQFHQSMSGLSIFSWSNHLVIWMYLLRNPKTFKLNLKGIVSTLALGLGLFELSMQPVLPTLSIQFHAIGALTGIFASKYIL